MPFSVPFLLLPPDRFPVGQRSGACYLGLDGHEESNGTYDNDLSRQLHCESILQLLANLIDRDFTANCCIRDPVARDYRLDVNIFTFVDFFCNGSDKLW